MDWLRNAVRLARSQQPFVIVTVVEVIGSAPREVGARIVVTKGDLFDSIGGGTLEYQAIEESRKLLANPSAAKKLDKFIGLGDMASQCCGGAVRLHFERVDGRSALKFAAGPSSKARHSMLYFVTPVAGDLPSESRFVHPRKDRHQLSQAVIGSIDALDRTSEPGSMLTPCQQWFVTRLDEKSTPVVLFGAGHVGQALIKALENLPFKIQWIDSRRGMFPSSVPANVTIRLQADPVAIVDEIGSQTFSIVMTHSHALDYDLVYRILQKREFGWLGLIGSATKRRRFDQRLLKAGIDQFTLQRLNCPIGLESVRGKHPAVIALSTSAQLLEERLRRNQAADDDREALHGR